MSLRVSKTGFNIREKLNELDRPVGVQGNNILQSNTTAESFSKIQAGRRNVVINGDMTIAQRGTSTTSITSDTYGACDRWELDLNGAGTWTMEQVGDAPYNTGFTHCTSLSCTTATTSISSHLSLRQKIEMGNLKGLMGGTPNAKPLTASFWVKSNEPGKYYVVLYRPRAGTDSSRISIAYTIEQSEVWEFKTITFPPDTMNGYQTSEVHTGLEIHFSLGYNQGSYGSAHYGHWHTNSAYLGKGGTNLAAATGNYWRITGVQLEIGNEHTEFEHLLYAEKLALCQRYYFKTTDAKGTVYPNGGTTTQVGLGVAFPVRMRVTPTLTLPTSVSSNVHNFGSANNSYTSGGQYGSNVDGGNFYMLNGNSATTGTFSVLNTNAYVEFNAEM
tara:strand:+ start:3631 stop:4791 length:1161 start_codon:yes stop_codon:yes gene_type:complete